MTVSRRAALLGLPLTLAGCGIGSLFDDNKKAVPGRRESILGTRGGLTVDPADRRTIVVPPPVTVANWPMSGGSPTHAIGNIAITGLKPVWSSGIGQGGGYRAKLTAQPVVLNGVVYTMDSDGHVAAFDLASGSRKWRVDTQADDNRSTNIGGGVAVEGATVYATTGRAEALALDAASGTIKWRRDIPSPARSGPTLAGGRMHFTTLENQLLALNMSNGDRVWSYGGDASTTSALADAAPAISDGFVVAGFGSGDLVTVRAESGAMAWSDTLASARARVGNTELSAIRALPVVDRGRVYAIGIGGLLVSLDLRSGRRLWERDVGGGQTPWIAGDWLYVQTSDQTLTAMSVEDGRPRWIQDLPRWDNPAKQRDALFWSGPIMVGGKLVLAGTSGQAVSIDPQTGQILGTQGMSSAVEVAPAAASGTVLILADDGSLQAFR